MGTLPHQQVVQMGDCGLVGHLRSSTAKFLLVDQPPISLPLPPHVFTCPHSLEGCQAAIGAGSLASQEDRR